MAGARQPSSRESVGQADQPSKGYVLVVWGPVGTSLARPSRGCPFRLAVPRLSAHGRPTRAPSCRATRCGSPEYGCLMDFTSVPTRVRTTAAACGATTSQGHAPDTAYRTAPATAWENSAGDCGAPTVRCEPTRGGSRFHMVLRSMVASLAPAAETLEAPRPHAVRPKGGNSGCHACCCPSTIGL